MVLRWFVILGMLLLAAGAFAADPPALAEGMANVSIGNYAAAVAELAPLVEAQPEDSVYNYWLGRAYYGQRSYLAAARCLEMAVRRDAANKDVGLWYGRALRQVGKLREAADVYRLYHQLFPRDNQLLGEYAAVRAMAGDYQGARETFAQLLRQDPSPQMQALVNDWNRALDGISTQAQLEPPCRQLTGQFELRYFPEDPVVGAVLVQLEALRRQVSEQMGLDISGFQVMLFPTWATYSRYARIFLPDSRQLQAVAFSQPGLLVLWSPGTWSNKRTTAEEFTTVVRHEMAHLAIAQRTGGQGVPLWLNEGLACYYGGWGGRQAGPAPAHPLADTDLDQAFLTGKVDQVEQAYAQAFAMATTLARKLGPKTVALLDALAEGNPLPQAYGQVAGEKWDVFLAEWPARYTALMTQAK